MVDSSLLSVEIFEDFQINAQFTLQLQLLYFAGKILHKGILPK